MLYLSGKIGNMIIIKVEKNENLDKALKKYKSKVIASGQIEELKRRKEHVKKSTLKREKLRKAKYRQYKQDLESK